MNKTSAILKALINDYGLPKELIAAKLGVHSRTIERWLNGENKPSFSAQKLLNQIYNGYKNVEK